MTEYLHLRAALRGTVHGPTRLDMSRAEAMAQVVVPLLTDQPIRIGHRKVAPDEIFWFRITCSTVESRGGVAEMRRTAAPHGPTPEWRYAADCGPDVTADLVTEARRTVVPGRETAVFISYRRADTAHRAGLLKTSLSDRLGRDVVFLDVAGRTGVRAGMPWRDVLADAIRPADVVIALLSSTWLHARDAWGRRLLDLPRDPVHDELTLAAELDKRIVPVSLGEPPELSEAALPPALAGLARLPVQRVSHESWDADVDRLVVALRSA